GDSPPGSNGPNEYQIRPISTDIGCVAPATIVNAENNQYFLAEDQFAALETITAFGDVNTVNVSFKIQPLMDKINRAAMRAALSLHYRSKDQIWLCYPD